MFLIYRINNISTVSSERLVEFVCPIQNYQSVSEIVFHRLLNIFINIKQWHCFCSQPLCFWFICKQKYNFPMSYTIYFARCCTHILISCTFFNILQKFLSSIILRIEFYNLRSQRPNPFVQPVFGLAILAIKLISKSSFILTPTEERDLLLETSMEIKPISLAASSADVAKAYELSSCWHEDNNTINKVTNT